jgi:LytS/YehU family sensor histidine kinase
MIYSDPSTADSMISKLSELLRYSIKTGDSNFIILSEEIETADKYIEIQKMRFGDRIRYTKQIDEKALQTQVPIFILQPFLENCIKHAVELTNDTVDIITAINIFDHNLTITIKNTVHNIDNKETINSFGEGLQNLKSRLEFLYQNRHSLSAGSSSVNEFEVKIKLLIGNGKEN